MRSAVGQGYARIGWREWSRNAVDRLGSDDWSRKATDGSQELSRAPSSCRGQGATEPGPRPRKPPRRWRQMAAKRQARTRRFQPDRKIARSRQDAEASGAVAVAVRSRRCRPSRRRSPSSGIDGRTDLWRSTRRGSGRGPANHGKGFAVVASEVRKIAERSQAGRCLGSGAVGGNSQVARTPGTMLATVAGHQEGLPTGREITSACREQGRRSSQVTRRSSSSTRSASRPPAVRRSSSTSRNGLQAETAWQADDPYFKINQDGRAMHSVARADRRRRQANCAPGRYPCRRRSRRKKPAEARRTVRFKVANGGGFAFEMNGHDDDHDADSALRRVHRHLRPALDRLIYYRGVRVCWSCRTRNAC